MGKELYDSFRIVKDTYDEADEILGLKISGISFEGPDEKLVETRFTQPALFVLSVAIARLLSESVSPPVSAAGHSLGEYSAFCASGAFSFEDGLRIVKLRGDLMFSSGVERPGAMAAVIGLKGEEIEGICEDYDGEGVVCVANYNSPAQSVISGDETAVESVIPILKTKGAKLVKKLHVSGAFHSPLMEPASVRLSQGLAEMDISTADFPVVVNAFAERTSSPERIREALKKQLTSPVQWVRSMEVILEDKPDIFIEAGSGRVLAGLLKRINKRVRILTTGTPKELDTAIKEMLS
jgi:[acyl-carrier-protein] S-malonyltransferase